MWGIGPPLYMLIIWSVHACAAGNTSVIPLAAYMLGVCGVLSSFGGTAATRPVNTLYLIYICLFVSYNFYILLNDLQSYVLLFVCFLQFLYSFEWSPIICFVVCLFLTIFMFFWMISNHMFCCMFVSYNFYVLLNDLQSHVLLFVCWFCRRLQVICLEPKMSVFWLLNNWVLSCHLLFLVQKLQRIFENNRCAKVQLNWYNFLLLWILQDKSLRYFSFRMKNWFWYSQNWLAKKNLNMHLARNTIIWTNWLTRKLSRLVAWWNLCRKEQLIQRRLFTTKHYTPQHRCKRLASLQISFWNQCRNQSTRRRKQLTPPWLTTTLRAKSNQQTEGKQMKSIEFLTILFVAIYCFISCIFQISNTNQIHFARFNL